MEPTIADKKPMMVELEKGKMYAWCACGRTNTQPFCDGSHKGTEFSPHVFQAEASEKKSNMHVQAYSKSAFLRRKP